MTGNNVSDPAFVEEQSSPPRPRSVSQLPDAAIDLANRMFDLARSGDALLLTYLSAGLPPNLTNNRGDTLLMLASYHGHAELVRRMLQEATTPPDVNQLNGRGQSIVAGAVFKGHDEVVRVLIECGADPCAGQPSAEECARMFDRWEGDAGYKELFEQAPGRGAGGKEARPAVEDREVERRVPGVGLQRAADTEQHESPDSSRPPFQAER